MKKIVFHVQTGYAGMDAWYFFEVPKEVTGKELDDFAYEMALENAESFGIYPYPDEDDELIDASDDQRYSHGIEGSWHIYDPKLHDRHATSSPPNWDDW